MPDTRSKTRKTSDELNRKCSVWKSTLLCLLSVLGLCAPSLRADPILPQVFSEHMVLQRDVAIAIWGWADPGEKISVSLAGRAVETVAGEDRRWRAVLAPTPAGGPFSLVVRGKKTVVVKDVMFGEVWVASGQSNMTYALSGAADADGEIPKAVNPLLRFFTVPRRISLTPQDDTPPANWELCSPETAKRFSAVAYFFARDLYKKLNVPIGIVLSAWPGTSAEEWTAPDELRREPILRPILQRWEAAPPEAKAYAARPTEFSLEFDDFELLSKDPGSNPSVPFSNFDDGTPRTATGGSWSYVWANAPESVLELISPGRNGSGYAVKVAGTLDGASSSELLAGFHADGSPADLSAYSGIRFWVRGNGMLQVQMLQPSITDADNYSADSVRASSEWRQVTVWFKDLKQEGWGVSKPFTPEGLLGIRIVNMTAVGDPDRPPSGLYEGMITPLEHFPIRGAIWYQGEGNTWRAYQYRTLLPALIRGWRQAWGEGDFPFLIVQLPNQGSSEGLGDSIWAELREAQLFTERNVVNAGLAVTIDVGEARNLHPPRKAEVGQRLALWALGTTYGKNMEYSGPLYDSMRILDGEIRIKFKHTGAGLQARGGQLKGFAIAGADRKFRWGEARIENDEVIVSSPQVSAPVAVRYAWADSPECNLYNKDGLPASPFRTDDWPGATYEKR